MIEVIGVQKTCLHELMEATQIHEEMGMTVRLWGDTVKLLPSDV